MLGGVNAEGEHDNYTAGAGGDWEGEGIEGFLVQAFDLEVGFGWSSGLRLFGVWMCVGLIEHRPADHGEHDAAGELHDGKRDAKEAKERGADELDDGEEDDGVDGDPAGEAAVDSGRGAPDEAEEDNRGAEWDDERKKRAEAQSEGFPEEVHRVHCEVRWLRSSKRLYVELLGGSR